MITPDPQPWITHGACRRPGNDPAWFFPVIGPGGLEQGRNAIIVCQTCPVITQCAKYAEENGEQWGIWGGKNRSVASQRGAA